jgi:Holliday junction resolvase-like predicted endonuclease
VLVFVEVKARRTSAFGGAAYAVHTRKQDKLVKLAANYLARYGLQDRTCRFDVLLCRERRTGAWRSSISSTRSKCRRMNYSGKGKGAGPH